MDKDWEDMKTNLLSSVTKEGKYVTQIIHFKGGTGLFRILEEKR